MRCKPMISSQPMPARCRYITDEYTLIVGPQAEAPPGMNRCTQGGLTLFFDPTESLLVALEAYSNAARWDQQSLVFPHPELSAGLQCLEPFDEHGIARGAGDEPRFTYSKASRLLRADLGTEQVDRWVRCLSCAVCGLSRQDILVAIVLEGVDA